MISVTHSCGDCGLLDNDYERFKHHRPCYPEAKTVWIAWSSSTSTGMSGRRATNTPEEIAAVIQTITEEKPFDIALFEVHHGDCNIGKTTPNPCCCYPETIYAP